MKNVDAAEQDLKNNPVQRNENEMSVLEKLLKINRSAAVVMATDMMAAGIDTVVPLIYLIRIYLEKY